ncbi:SRPBCC family protein [Amycolatopsis sp. A133]|uniref:SRPBCC family protein n=1 Tax=Amycolatopsis sp. A133 TaxID=3064472 RepID=UPI0027F9C3F4|nr:SRPBCC family protein [Amycolatopsis sp. A133]MDQ7802877.1 SRPBCC family protein [Amycolatopsis sp. A133]
MSGRAKLQTVDQRPVLRLERRLKHAPERVWRVITDPAELAHWFPARVDVDLRAGGAIRFTFPGDDTTTAGQVVTADPPREFTFVWNDDTLRWLISPDGDGSLLEFTHTFGRGDPAIAKLAAGRNAAGWDVCLDALDARLAGRDFQQPQGWHERTASYVEEFGLDEGEILADGTIRFRRDLVWKPVAEVRALLPAEPGWHLVHDPLNGTRVEFTEAASDDVPAQLARRHEQLDKLFAATHGVELPDWAPERVEAVKKHYAERPTQG